MEGVSRMIHHIISVRQRHPFTKILGGKTDEKPHTDEYHCMGVQKKNALYVWRLGLTGLRLTFGGSPCPNEFCLFSELCMDLANDTLNCPS
jgi:hypothetical protein